MADNEQTIGDLADLGAATGVTPATAPAPLPEPKIDAQGRSYATGKRKDAVARVWVKRGAGKITINGRTLEVYFARPVLRMLINQPFLVTNRANQFDVDCTVTGGGLSGQAGAVRHGISRSCARRLSRWASSPAIRAWSSARSTAVTKRDAATSSPSANRAEAFLCEGRPGGAPFVFVPARLVVRAWPGASGSCIVRKRRS